ncbi:MAG: neutral/alkaline non-lysosomal ceramidase N-terminal domain-containing protein [Gemmataceae bacterium]
MLRPALVALLVAAPLPAADVAPAVYQVGVAEVDITPTHPVRLNGFGFRRTESEGVNHPIHARAIAIKHPDDPHPVVLLTADVLGIPAPIRAELEKRLQAKLKLPPDRLATTATHTHTGPMLSGANPTIFGVPIPPEHQANIDRYTPVFLDKLEQVAVAAVADAKPAKLFWGVGSVGFAKNRRGRPVAPTDHDLPVLVARDAATNAVRAVYTAYACHCVTLSHNKVGGDWAGYAAEAIREATGGVGLVAIGCGADQNPDSGVTGDKVEVAQVQGRQVAAEVKRLLAGGLAPVQGRIVSRMKAHSLPLAPLPTRAEWEDKARRTDAVGHHARVTLAKLDRGEPLPTAVEYPVQTWAFGDSLAMVHLPGEVVVDYALRLKSELDRTRLWVTAYANTNPCYIPSERVLKEGGYEGGGAMIYYDLPAAFRPGLEQVIVDEVTAQLGQRFAPKYDPKKTDGTHPLSPQQSAAAVRVRPGLAVDLVAGDPLVADPVALAFGPDGKLWVAEMADYPLGLDGKFSPGGRVRLLTDRDGDGRFDTATVFLDKLPMPTGLTVWRKGVLVCAAPDILYAEDTDGDGQADVVKKLFSGFGTENYQARVNSLTYGLDGWVYGSCGLFGGKILSHLTGRTTELGDRDFRINPDTGSIEPATGRTQQGRVRDDWGNWFGCDNSTLAWHHALPDEYLRRNPHVPPPRPTTFVPTGADPNRLFPIGPQQLFALSGPAGRTTGACGIGVYRDTALGAGFAGNTFTCEPVNRIIHRLTLTPSGSTFQGVRPKGEADREFFASADPWSRPVQAITGPDGGLWVADMYRLVIEHPRWIPAADLERLDVRAGAGMGRIYRVRAADQPVKPWPRLDKLDAAGLVAALDSANGWQRDTATELLAWRADRAAVPHLAKLLTDSQRPEARLHALAALDRLGGLTPEHVRRGLADSHPGVRRHAVRLSERFPRELGPEVAGQADHPNAQVRLQVAFTLGLWADPAAGEVLAELATRTPADPLLRAAAVSSLTRANFPAFAGKLTGSPPPLLAELIATAAGFGDAGQLAGLLKQAAEPKGGTFAPWQFATADAVLVALDRTKATHPAELVTLVAAARAVAIDEKAAPAARTAAVKLLGREPTTRAADIGRLAMLLAPQTPAAVRSAAVAALGHIPDDAAADALLAGWAGYTPAAQAQVVDVLLDRDAWSLKLLAAITAGSVPPSAVPPGPRQGLLTEPGSAAIREAAAKAFGSISPDRQRVLAEYFAAVPTLTGDAARGRQVFAKVCGTCHKLDGQGHAVGPDLAALANKSAAYLLGEILDPNRNLDSRYVEYATTLADGRTLTGLLASESAAAVVLMAPDGKETTVLRADLERLRASGRSLMPEGLEKDVPPPAMADLIAYLGSVGSPAKAVAGNAPAVVRPANGRLDLPASAAEIRGTGITFETEFGNVGYWHGPQDHVTWRVESPAAGKYDVYLDYACDDGSAGNRFALDVGGQAVRGTVASTGGWASYRLAKVGTVPLPAGPGTVTVRPDADHIRGALMDLRAVRFVPAGQPPAPAVAKLTPAEVARKLLDDTLKPAEREAVLRDHPADPAAVITAMAAGLPRDAKEEYRRIPWIWRVAIAAGKRNDAAELRAVLDASLPKPGEPLRDWQAVVIGGGVINGISMAHGWPGPRLAEVVDARLKPRWDASLKAAVAMADDPKVPTGTRYDALRMTPLPGWATAGGQLTKYLAKGTHEELQQGAVSGLVDVDAPEATAALVAALAYLTGENRELAAVGLTRTPARAAALLDAVERGQVAANTVPPAAVEKLLTAGTDATKARARAVFRK